MAGHDLIDRYLEGLRGRIRWRRDAAEIIAEQRRLLERFGDERQVASALATVGMVFTGLGAAAGIFSWFIAGWGTLMAIGAALFVIAMSKVGIAPRWATLAVGAAWILGLSTFAALRAIEFGGVDEWGDYPAASLAGLTLGSVVFAVGLGSLGGWMHGEEPVVLEPTEPALPA